MAKIIKMFTNEEISKATDTDLYEFLLIYFPDEIIVQGNWLRLKSDNSVNVSKGSRRFIDFSGRYRAGSALDVLTLFFGYDFVSGMKFLLNPQVQALKKQPVCEYTPKEFKLPVKDKGYRNTIAYLTKTRLIPAGVINTLIKKKLIYQSINVNEDTGNSYRNIVFVNEKQDYYEIHGTSTLGRSFHGCNKTNRANYWSFGKGNPETVYICEAAIDAISLFVINALMNKANNTLYVSIGGVSNYETIEQLKIKYGNKCVLAVDNDSKNPNGNAGRKCLERFPDMRCVIPQNKDWNDDLKGIMMSKFGAKLNVD